MSCVTKIFPTNHSERRKSRITGVPLGHHRDSLEIVHFGAVFLGVAKGVEGPFLTREHVVPQGSTSYFVVVVVVVVES